MPKPYHIKLKRTTKNLSDTQVQNYNDLKWGEPVLTNDGYIVVGDKSTNTPDVDNRDNYQSHAISGLKVLKLLPKVVAETISSVQHYIYNRFTFYKAGSSSPASGTHVTLLKLNSAENGVDVILPDTEAGYVAYNSSTNYGTGTVGNAVKNKLDLSGGTMTGNINMNGNSITGLPNTAPTQATDVATKGYVDSTETTYAFTSGVDKFTVTPSKGGTAQTAVTVNVNTNVTNSNNKMFLVGSASQTNGAATNTNSNVYATNGALNATSATFTGNVNANNGVFTTGATIGGAAVATQSYVDTAISNMGSFIKVVSTVPTTTDPAEIKKLYVVKMTATSGSTTYTEYVPYIYDSGWKPLSAIW